MSGLDRLANDDEAILDLRIRQDGTFTHGHRDSIWSREQPGQGVYLVGDGRRHDKRHLRNEVGPWQWITLVRRGNTLYGVANDPAIQSAVMLRFDRDSGSGATAVEQ